MDWMTLDRLSHIRQQEILEQAAKDRAAQPMRPLLYQLGGSLVIIGQKLMQAAHVEPPARANAEHYTYPSGETDAR